MCHESHVGHGGHGSGPRLDLALVTNYLAALTDRPGIVFVHHKASAEGLCAALCERGVSVDWVTGDRTLAVRLEIASRLRTGQLHMVITTDAWSAGIDIPEIRWVAIEAWSSAPVGVMQRAGRGARLADGKLAFTVHLLPGSRMRKAREVLVDRGYDVAPIDERFSISELIRRGKKGKHGGCGRAAAAAATATTSTSAGRQLVQHATVGFGTSGMSSEAWLNIFMIIGVVVLALLVKCCHWLVT